VFSSLPRGGNNAPFDTTFDTLMNPIFLARAEQALGNRAIAQTLVAAAHTTTKVIVGSPEVALLIARLEAEQRSPLAVRHQHV
jgi:hypothetical protein